MENTMRPNRRNALVGFALAGALPLALAATRSLAQDGTPAESSGAEDYVKQTLTVGTVALQSSQVAVDKATDPMVKEFANIEVAEQTTIATVLSATAAGKEPPALPDDDAQKVKALQDTEAGATFDKAYIDAQIEGHQKLLDIQKSLSGQTDPTVEVITAKLAEQAITSHLAMLGHIKEQLGA
jgi:predicted outer membrane protein